ncbi:MAG: NUDIX hydrolase [Hellea sp.]
MTKPIDCVGVICFRGDDVLLIKRGTAPRKGEWSIPGGRIELGETEREAALRELFEETGITAALEDKVATIDAQFEDFNYRLHDYAARWTSGEPVFGDDAADARFVAPSDLDALGMWPKTREVIETARLSLLNKDGVQN